MAINVHTPLIVIKSGRNWSKTIKNGYTDTSIDIDDSGESDKNLTRAAEGFGYCIDEVPSVTNKNLHQFNYDSELDYSDKSLGIVHSPKYVSQHPISFGEIEEVITAEVNEELYDYGIHGVAGSTSTTIDSVGITHTVNGETSYSPIPEHNVDTDQRYGRVNIRVFNKGGTADASVYTTDDAVKYNYYFNDYSYATVSYDDF